jgi:hypothetical protein
MLKYLLVVAIGTCVLLANQARAGTVDVTVAATAGPWVQSLNPSSPYGVGDNTAPTIVIGLTSGESVTVAYVSGLTSSFYSVPPTVDANGYGPANGYNPPPFTSDNLGSSGTHLPGYYTTSPSTVVLNELLGVFTNAGGVIVGKPFAIGDGPVTVTDPAGATQLQLGVNDDIYYYSLYPDTSAGYPDNTGSLQVSVSADSLAQTPLPAALPLFAGGLGALGLFGWRKKRKSAAVATA